MAVLQGTSEALKLAKHATIAPGVPFVPLTIILLSAGVMIQRWLADLIDTKGIGEGIGALLAINIVSSESMPSFVSSLPFPPVSTAQTGQQA